MPGIENDRLTQRDAGHDWALVLAAGEGSRLRSLTTLASGIAVPKQFCSLGRGTSLLQDAVQRARQVVAADRVCAVVAEHHGSWWRSLPHAVHPANMVVQPRNRGTAHGILLPLLQILHRDPDASLLVLPSDHYVRNESVLAASLGRAVGQVEQGSARIVLLGVAPEEADSELGYIVPGAGIDTPLREVSEFVEKPSAAAARGLIERGGLWNAFIFAAHGQTLLRAFERHCPRTVADMRRVLARDDEMSRRCELAALYEQLPPLDFSRDILASNPGELQVLAVPQCGWSDLGTPRRVADVIRRHRLAPSARTQLPPTPRMLDLVAQQMGAL